MTPTVQVILAILVVGALLFLLSGKKSKAKDIPVSAPVQNTMSIPPGWWLFRKVLMQNRPEVLPDGSLRISVPVGAGGDLISHVLDGTPRTLAGSTALVTRGTVTGGPIIVDEREYQHLPPTLCHFISRKDADLSNPNHRFYSQGTVELKEGEFVLVSSLQSDVWINRDGQKNDAEFKATLANPGGVGYATGAEIGRAHGIHAAAPTTITLGMALN